MLVLGFIVGLGLGAFFFGGLWWTVAKAASMKNPALWFMGGFLVRTAVVLSGFYFFGHAHWERFVMCLLGFIAARSVLLSRARPDVLEARDAS